MNSPKTPRNGYMILLAGVVIGGISFASISSGFPKMGSPTGSMPVTSATPRVISTTTEENLAGLRALDSSFANLAEFVEPAVVHIKSQSGRQMTLGGERVPMQGGEGSGFIFRPDGYIITNDHVVGGFEKVTVVLKDGREFDGKVIRAEDSDIAVVKIEAKDLPTLAFGDSDEVRVGQFSMAVGSPFGLESSVTIGHISAKGRIKGIQDRLYPDLIQTDTAINMGNSGGPLVNIEGKVIGINTAIFSTTGGSNGIGFAIPSKQARFIAEILVEKGKITRSMLGLVPDNLKPFQLKELNLAGGALVNEVQSDGPAAAAGIKEKDIIVKIGNAPINSQLDLRNAMLTNAPGTEVPVELLRGKERKTVRVKLVEYKRPPVSAAMPRGEVDPREFFRRFQMPGEESPLPNNRGRSLDEDVPQIREGNARLGVRVEDLNETNRKQFNVPAGIKGALVLSIEPGSVAEKFGMQQGDVILQLGETTISTAGDLTKAMQGVKWGDSVRIKASRYGANSRMTQDTEIRFR